MSKRNNGLVATLFTFNDLIWSFGTVILSQLQEPHDRNASCGLPVVGKVSVIRPRYCGADMMHSLKEALMGDHVTNWFIACFAVISPMWLPWLQDVSTIAALLLPILGGLWLLVQIWAKLFFKSK